MLIAIYQLLLFGIGPIRKRVLHWLEEASDATDFKPYIINSELYMGITCVIPFVYVLIMAIASKFMNDESVAMILNWEYHVSFMVRFVLQFHEKQILQIPYLVISEVCI